MEEFEKFKNEQDKPPEIR
jgi:hypothetical protein